MVVEISAKNPAGENSLNIVELFFLRNPIEPNSVDPVQVSSVSGHVGTLDVANSSSVKPPLFVGLVVRRDRAMTNNDKIYDRKIN